MEKTVLVVDDIPANRNLLRETLEPEGYEVLLAGDGETALKVMGRVRPHVVLLDVNMPGMDGYEVCRRLKQSTETSDVPVIFITANDDAESVVKGFEAGGVDFLSKPFKSEEVLARLDTHLRINLLTQDLAEKNGELEMEVGKRREAEEEANRANEAKSRFLSFISHEMRAPLNAINGFSEELMEILGEADGSYEADRIHRSGKHLLGLINNLLDLSKIEAGKMPLSLGDFDLKALVEDVCKDVRPLVDKNGNELVLELGEAGLTIRADETKVRQVLLNLLSNAGKFTKEGKVGIRLGAGEVDGVEGVTVAVSDSGIGMNEEEMGRLFQPYQQANDGTAAEFGGTGLGLAISRQFCRLMGGDLTVTSEKGNGATFTMRVPVVVVVG